mgnify:CR=1 FL=1
MLKQNPQYSNFVSEMVNSRYSVSHIISVLSDINKYPELINNSKVISDKCDVEIEFGKFQLPKYSDEIEEGLIISQTPEYKENFNINITEPVTLVVSKGQKLISLPKKIIGKKLEEVTAELDSLELRYAVTEEFNEEIELGVIISLDQEEGSEISASTILNIVISKGSQFKDVAVPQLTGRTEAEAKADLEALGLVADISYEENTSKSDGIVTAQSIGKGKTIKEGSTVEIIVNKLPVKATVTINVNLKSILAYKEPDPITDTTVDETGNTVTTTTTPEIESANVIIKVGEDTIENASYKKNRENISKKWTASGVKEVRVIIDGVTRFTQTVDFNKGDQTVEVK